MNDTLVKYPGLPGSARRYGHSSVFDSSNSSVLVFGGFNGLILGDMFKLVIGEQYCYVRLLKGALNGNIVKAGV